MVVNEKIVERQIKSWQKNTKVLAESFITIGGPVTDHQVGFTSLKMCDYLLSSWFLHDK